MKTLKKIALMLGASVAAPTTAATLSPITYEVQTPNNGIYAYQDDTYSGSNVSGYLSGGTGDLTDGVIAEAHWNVTPTPWVGWADVNPTIIFHFAANTVLDTIDFYFDDAMGAGAVSLPLGVTFTAGAGPLLLTPTITTDGIVGRYRYNLGGMLAEDLSATLVRSNQWVMLSEATFNGSVGAGAVPEPATWALMIGGFGLVGTMSRRRRSYGKVAA